MQFEQLAKYIIYLVKYKWLDNVSPFHHVNCESEIKCLMSIFTQSTTAHF